MLHNVSQLYNIGREGRNEMQIKGPKEVLVSMRTDQQYRETKMLLLHKLTGIDFLTLAYSKDTKNTRDWFTGSFRYKSASDILSRYMNGKVLSCSRNTEANDNFHVFFFGGDVDVIKYLTFVAKPSYMFVQEAGVHFCSFILKKEKNSTNALVKTLSKEKLSSMSDHYALMLPYIKVNCDFAKQFTLVYHDWDVLQCRCGKVGKGFPTPDCDVFSKKYIELLEILRSNV